MGSRISVFAFTATDGLVFVRAVGQGVIASLRSFAFSGAGELLVVDFNRKKPTVFDDLGQQGALAAGVQRTARASLQLVMMRC